MTSASDEKWRLFNFFFQSGRAKYLSALLYSLSYSSLKCFSLFQLCQLQLLKSTFKASYRMQINLSARFFIYHVALLQYITQKKKHFKQVLWLSSLSEICLLEGYFFVRKRILKQMLLGYRRGICGSIKLRKPDVSTVRRTKALVITRNRKKTIGSPTIYVSEQLEK